MSFQAKLRSRPHCRGSLQRSSRLLARLREGPRGRGGSGKGKVKGRGGKREGKGKGNIGVRWERKSGKEKERGRRSLSVGSHLRTVPTPMAKHAMQNVLPLIVMPSYGRWILHIEWSRKKIAQSLMHHHFATVCSIAQFSPKCSEKISVYQSM